MKKMFLLISIIALIFTFQIEAQRKVKITPYQPATSVATDYKVIFVEPTGRIAYEMALSDFLTQIFASPTFTGTAIINGATASTMAGYDANKGLITLATSTYPSLTELSYVKGLTSAVQSQINAKAPVSSPTFTGTATSPKFKLGTNGVVVDSAKVVVDTLKFYVGGLIYNAVKGH